MTTFKSVHVLTSLWLCNRARTPSILVAPSMSSELAPSPAAASSPRSLRVLSQAQLDHLHREGYVVVADVLTPQVIDALLSEYSGVLDEIVRELRAEGKLQSDYRDLDFGARLIAVCKDSGQNFPQRFDFSLPQGGIKRDTPLSVGPAVFRTITNDRLLDLVSDVLGTDEIWSNPVQHMRFKLPLHALAKDAGFSGMVSAVPFHQDNAVILSEADSSDILTIWMPLMESTVENGVMQVVPRSHLRELQQHCHTREGLAIPPSVLDPANAGAISLPMPAGSALLMTHRTIHKSLDNTTEGDVRASMDLRYQRTGTPSGRPAFAKAGFVARSLTNPESVLRDPKIWAQNWHDLRTELAEREEAVAKKQAEAAVWNRWDPKAVGCA